MGVFSVIAEVTGVPVQVLLAICQVETGLNLNTGQVMDGGSPSYGVCQVKLLAARQVGFKGHPSELLHSSTNVFYAALYLKYQTQRYNSCKFGIIAYNRGKYRRRYYNSQYYKKVEDAAGLFGAKLNDSGRTTKDGPVYCTLTRSYSDYGRIDTWPATFRPNRPGSSPRPVHVASYAY